MDFISVDSTYWNILDEHISTERRKHKYRMMLTSVCVEQTEVAWFGAQEYMYVYHMDAKMAKEILR